MSSHRLWAASADRPSRISARQLDKLALVYIRQSSMQQVYRNQESTKLQYRLVELAQHLGWPADRILVLDEDLGISGASSEGRSGFQRLLSEIALDHAGLILGVEMSRLARCNRDFHQLLELCARFGTLIADLDGLYDPSEYNDRLLLGLKGTMSEAELHILRQRLLQGKMEKARRGELSMPVPTGYLLLPTGEVVLDPDEEVQAVVRLVFDEFRRLGSILGVLRSVHQKGVRIGVRQRALSALGELAWHAPRRGMIVGILRNPIYAGAYVYGRRQLDPRRQKPGRAGTGRTPLLPADRWLVCLRDRLPAYISWQQYEQNQQRLLRNQQQLGRSGVSRNGAALLAGLLRCGRCGLRMSAQYSSAKRGGSSFRYVCQQAALRRAEPVCASLSGARLDEVVTELALRALEPAALELSLRVSDELEHERKQTESLWHKRLERARYEAQRAERQYRAVEPENRLVARNLERAWEEKLQAERELQEEHRRRQQQRPHALSPHERDQILRLASDLPALWQASTTTPADRKAVLRLLLEQIEVTLTPGSTWVELGLRWAGGHTSQTRLRRPVGKLCLLENHQALLAEIHGLRRNGYTATQIAQKLNEAGWTTPTQKSGFNERLVRMMLHRHGSVPRGPKRPPSEDKDLWWLHDLADQLEIPLPTLYGWMRRGRLRAQRVQGQWAVWADSQERARLRRLRERSRADKPSAAPSSANPM